jgi:hypothetical protein
VDLTSVWLLAVAAGSFVTGIRLIWSDRQRRRRRPPLTARLAPFAPTPLADEVEAWLRQQKHYDR